MVRDYALLLDRARALASPGERRLLGIAGSPGSGKSTLAQRLITDLGPIAALAPMDGFHRTNAELDQLGWRTEKGSPRTFDAAGFVALLRDVRSAGPEPVTGPGFDRVTDEPVPAAWSIGPEVALVVVEGNYLLLKAEPWHAIRPMLDEAWFCAPAADVRLDRLVSRHVQFGRTPEDAAERATGSDEANAALVEASRRRADLLVVL